MSYETTGRRHPNFHEWIRWMNRASVEELMPSALPTELLLAIAEELDHLERNRAWWQNIVALTAKEWLRVLSKRFGVRETRLFHTRHRLYPVARRALRTAIAASGASSHAVKAVREVEGELVDVLRNLNVRHGP